MKAETTARRNAIVFTLTLLTIAGGTAMAQQALITTSWGVIVSNPNILPPTGSGAAWVDHPCSHDLRFDADWMAGGEEFKGTFALAHNAIVTDFGTPTLTTDGNDVISTFNATLHIAATVVVGFPANPPTPLTLPGTISARFIGKAGKTTGTFLLKIESMSFSATLFSVQIAARQDPGHDSVGSITITDLGNGTFRIASGLDAYTQLSAFSPLLNPPGWLPYVPDMYAPIHFELRASGCPPGSYPFAAFTVSPAAPLSGHPVAFTDTSAGAPTSWSWDFGDGATSTTRNPTHTYASAGKYAVRLAVTNASGSDSVANLETVGPGTPPDPRKQVRRVLRGIAHGRPVG